MANIPVERTGSATPWWLWLLGLLLLALLIWFLVGAFGDDDDDVATVDPIEETAPAPVVAGDIDSGLDLSTLYVTRVTGDRAFYVSPTDDGTGPETLVILDQNMSPDVAGIEGQVDVNPGQMVDLSGGSLEPFGDADVLELGIPDADANALSADTDVIRIDGGDVSVYEQDLQNVEVGE